MKISRTKFYIIIVIILLLPLSKNWRLLLFGHDVTGVVKYHRDISAHKGYYRYSIIFYEVNNQEYQVKGPANVVYPVGKKIKIKYRDSNPSKCIPLNLSTIYFGKQMAFPGFLLIVWLALYINVKNNPKIKNDESKI